MQVQNTTNTTTTVFFYMHIFLFFFYFLDYNIICIILAYRHVNVIIFFLFISTTAFASTKIWNLTIYIDEQQRENKGFILLTPDSGGQNLHSPHHHRCKNHESQDGGRDRKPSRTATHIILCEHTVRWARDTQA